MRRTLRRGFWDLELHLEGRKLADSEALVPFGNLLPFSNVANHNGTGKGCA